MLHLDLGIRLREDDEPVEGQRSGDGAVRKGAEDGHVRNADEDEAQREAALAKTAFAVEKIGQRPPQVQEPVDRPVGKAEQTPVTEDESWRKEFVLD